MSQPKYEPLTVAKHDEVFASFFAAASDEYDAMYTLAKPVIGHMTNGLDVLSIGAGNGFFDLLLFSRLGLKIDSYHVVEPCKTRAEELRHTFRNKKYVVTVDPSYFNENFKIEKKFDIILMTHSLYYTGDPLETLLNAKAMLKEDGKLLVFLAGDEDNLFRKLDELAKPNGKPISNQNITAQYVMNILTEKSVSYQFSSHNVSYLITDFILRHATSSATHVVDMLIQTEYERLPNPIKNELYQFVLKNSYEDGEKWKLQYKDYLIVLC